MVLGSLNHISRYSGARVSKAFDDDAVWKAYLYGKSKRIPNGYGGTVKLDVIIHKGVFLWQVSYKEEAETNNAALHKAIAQYEHTTIKVYERLRRMYRLHWHDNEIYMQSRKAGISRVDIYDSDEPAA